ncbi:hypothetical protein [Pseudidiomarina taiwanensis]|uniref:Oligosaccharide repeat unit polymerase n=1 Tax=Pseudidiomarina taiwanensis TaxID=337250 RepID=A0A432ZLW9_9GAMM|nr:hypothetical protein [Pseudidiomarina taiwanensis]RUO78392.1 hypothetical protein CWI83_05015 [Pseudidiomarina taiwanensis]
MRLKIARLTVFDILLIVIVFFAVLPLIYPKLISMIGNYVIWYVLFASAWVLITFSTRPAYFLFPTKFRLVVFIVIALIILVPFLAQNIVLMRRFISLSSILMFFLFYDFNKSTSRQHITKYILLLIIPFVLLTSIETLIALERNAFISRAIKSSGERTLDILSQGIGGYDFIYSLVIVVPLLISRTLEVGFIRKPFKGLLCITLLTLMTAVILKSNYFTALVMMIVGVIIIAFKHVQTSKLKSIYIPLLFFSSVVGITTFSGITLWAPEILGVIETIFGSSLTGERLTILIEYLAYGNDLSAITTREGVLLQGVVNSFSYFPFGLIFSQESDRFYQIITHHSFIFDTLSILGWLGGLFIYCIFLPLISRLRRGQKFEALSVLVPFIIVSINNNLSYLIGFTTFFVVLYILDTKTLNNE